MINIFHCLYVCVCVHNHQIRIIIQGVGWLFSLLPILCIVFHYVFVCISSRTQQNGVYPYKKIWKIFRVKCCLNTPNNWFFSRYLISFDFQSFSSGFSWIIESLLLVNELLLDYKSGLYTEKIDSAIEYWFFCVSLCVCMCVI